jgi:hypothetical protein
VIKGLGFEIQSDSIGSGNHGLPEAPLGVPHDLTPPESERLAKEMLKGFRYCRLAGGLYWRGLDAEKKILQPRWPEQLSELRDLLDTAGVEGVSLEYWSPAPFWKGNQSYTGLRPNDSANRLRCFAPGFADDPVYHGDTNAFLSDFAAATVADIQTLKAAGIKTSLWGLQNEPDGPWQRFGKPIVDISSETNAPDALLTSNPSVAQRPDGGVLMVYKAVAMHGKPPFGGPVTHLVTTADNPLGPFTKHPGEVFGAKGVMFAAEDPFIWHGKDRYWAVVKDNDGNFTHRGYSLALWESADGMDWKLSKHPFVANPGIIKWADGHEETLTALERPQIVFENGEPVALCCAAANDKSRHGSFNVQIPLKVAK